MVYGFQKYMTCEHLSYKTIIVANLLKAGFASKIKRHKKSKVPYFFRNCKKEEKNCALDNQSLIYAEHHFFFQFLRRRKNHFLQFLS